MRQVLTIALILLSAVGCSSAPVTGRELYSVRVGYARIQLGDPLPEGMREQASSREEYFEPSLQVQVVELHYGTNSIVLEKETGKVVAIMVREGNWEPGIGIRVGDDVAKIKKQPFRFIVGARRVLLNPSTIYHIDLKGTRYALDLEMGINGSKVTTLELLLAMSED